MNHFDYTKMNPDIESRVDALLAKMTIEDKVGQMCQDGLNTLDQKEIIEKCEQGQLGSVICYFEPEEMNKLQRRVIENSPQGIPLLIAGDVIHGFKTTFPIPLAESCSFSPELAQRTARAAAQEAAARGIHLILAPMVDIARDPRWGRVAEGAGEDCFLGCALSAARCRGFQAGDLTSNIKTAACPKHFVGYGGAEGGRDYNSVEMSENTLRDTYLPPFLAGFDAGAPVVMSAFHDLNGVPCTINAKILKTILIDERQWPGFVLSDWNAVGELIAHGVAANGYEACVKAINAGVHMDMGSGFYNAHLAEAVRRGDVDAVTVDDAVRRILRVKFQLGLFENPYVDESLDATICLSPEHRELAFEAACESMVLLKNQDNLLPLSKDIKRLAVIGPLADDANAPLGCWPCRGRDENVTTILAGLKNTAPDNLEITYAKGCDVQGDAAPDFPDAIRLAESADIILAVLGETSDLSGEAKCRTHLGLPGRQQELLESLKATGKPVVLVLQNGRPLAMKTVEPHADAILEAWHAGIATGDAAAAILYGKVNPSAKLAISLPESEGQIPAYYGIHPTGRPNWGDGTRQFEDPYRSRYLDAEVGPFYPFGHGLSYTTFELDALTIHTPELKADESLRLSVKVANTGAREGKETIQLYIHDRVASMVRPIRELKAIEQVSLAPGESTVVELDIPVAAMGFHNVEMNYVVEPGEFEVFVGTRSDNGLVGRFEVLPT